MKRKFTELEDTDTNSNEEDEFAVFSQRKRRRRNKLIESPTPSQSDEDHDDDRTSMHASQTRAKSISLSQSDTNANDENKTPHQWSCPLCTFLNEEIAQKCKMCDTQRTASSAANAGDDDDDEYQMEQDQSTADEGSETDGDSILLARKNNASKARFTKTLRVNGGNTSKLTVKKQASIVDLTANDDEVEEEKSNDLKRKNLKQTRIAISVKAINGTSALNKKRSRKLPLKNTKKVAKKKEKPQMSSISGTRSREEFYAKQVKQKRERAEKRRRSLSNSKSPDLDSKHKRSKSTQSTKAKNTNEIEDISEDSDCVIVPTSKSHKTKVSKPRNKKANKRSKADKSGPQIQVVLDDERISKRLQSEQWIDKYTPKHVDDLYIHKKKYEEIDKWFGDALEALDDLSDLNSTRKVTKLQHVRSVLFLVGQSGIGKTSVVECLCDKYNAQLLCYPPEDANTKVFNQSVWDNQNTHFMAFNNMSSRNTRTQLMDLGSDSQLDKFDAFLNRSKRFGALKLNLVQSDHTPVQMNKRQVILVKELPYVGKPEYLHRFREIVERLCNSTRNIVVFEITSEFEGTKDDLQMFGSNVRFHPRATTIRFNPINKTLMKKCLNNILTAENLKDYIVNATGLVDEIIENERGDLRNAIQSMQMKLVELTFSGKDDGDDDSKKAQNTKKSTKQKRKYNKNKRAKVSSIKTSQNVGGKEETLSIFHSLGKVLYAKKETEPEEVIEKGDLDCMIFTDLLYENFGDFFIYNEHFQSSKTAKTSPPKQVQLDEFGFEIDVFDDAELQTQKQNDIVFEKYCQTLEFFGDADICCEYYNRLRYEDTSTDLRSTVNNSQFGSQLFPALYAASIASRGYLLSHDKPPKLKHNKRGLQAFRGSTNKLVSNLRQELHGGFNDVLIPKSMKASSSSVIASRMQSDEHYLNQEELGLLRSFICHPNSIYIEIFPLIANIQSRSIEQECRMKQLAVSMIRTSNWYSHKYEWKKFNVARFDYLQKAIAYNAPPDVRDAHSDDEGGVLDEIEEFDD